MGFGALFELYVCYILFVIGDYVPSYTGNRFIFLITEFEGRPTAMF